ncbi:MAG: hypothetical protein ACRENM_02300 [Candidatus Dormibacteraceae bacterium]
MDYLAPARRRAIPPPTIQLSHGLPINHLFAPQATEHGTTEPGQIDNRKLGSFTVSLPDEGGKRGKVKLGGVAAHIRHGGAVYRDLRIAMRRYDVEVRTTISLDEDVLEAARAIARVEGRALGAIISDLARRGLVPPEPRIDEEDGFPVFVVRPGAAPITDQMVKAALEEV